MELLCYGCKGTPFPLSLQKNAEEKCGRKQCVLSVSYLKSPKPQCLSAFQRSEIRVTTESQRRQNGGRTEAGPTRGGVWILTAFHNCLPVFPGGESLGFAQFAQFAQMRSLAH